MATNPNILTALNLTGGFGAQIASSLYGADQATRQVEMTNAANLEATDRTNQANMDLSKFKYQKDLEQWDRENIYNSPSAQMQRFKDAGLNPNLMYGQGSNGNAATNVRYNQATLQAPKFDYRNPQANALRSQAIMSASQVGKVFAETDLIKRQAKIADAQASNIEADTELKGINTKIKQIEESYKSQTLSEALKGLKADNKQKAIALETQRSEQYAKLAQTIKENSKIDAETQATMIDNLYQMRTLEQRVIAASLNNDIKEQRKALNELSKVYKEYENSFAKNGIRIGEQNMVTGTTKYFFHEFPKDLGIVADGAKNIWNWYDHQVGKGISKVKGIFKKK